MFGLPKIEHLLQAREQRRQIVLDDGPNGIGIDTKICVNQPVARRDNQAPGNLGMGFAHLVWNVRRRFTDQFEIAQGASKTSRLPTKRT